MKLSEQIKDKQVSSNIANECVQLMENQVDSKKGLTGVAFKAIYKGIKTISSDYAYNAIMGLLPTVSKEIDPLWEKGLSDNKPVEYLKSNQSSTANAILNVTDVKIQNAQNKIVKASYGKIRGTLEHEIEEAVPQLADILGKYISH